PTPPDLSRSPFQKEGEAQKQPRPRVRAAVAAAAEPRSERQVSLRRHVVSGSSGARGGCCSAGSGRGNRRGGGAVVPAAEGGEEERGKTRCPAAARGSRSARGRLQPGARRSRVGVGAEPSPGQPPLLLQLLPPLLPCGSGGDGAGPAAGRAGREEAVKAAGRGGRCRWRSWRTRGRRWLWRARPTALSEDLRRGQVLLHVNCR
ncbi:hypothetical protein EI555_001114, partial [Monodon monoceros]